MSLPSKIDFYYNTEKDTWEIYDTFNGTTIATFNNELFRPQLLVEAIVNRYNSSRKSSYNYVEDRLNGIEEAIEDSTNNIKIEIHRLREQLNKLKEDA